MTASNTIRAIDALVKKWEAEGVKIGKPNSLKEIKEFEQAHQVKLPDDFTQYLLKANGMRPVVPDTDKNGYCFWPLERIRSTADELREPCHRTAEIDLENPELAKYFIFADYLQWSWAFAIRISGTYTDTCEVFRVGAPHLVPKLASSFTEFVDLYLADSVCLYDPWPAPDQSAR